VRALSDIDLRNPATEPQLWELTHANSRPGEQELVRGAAMLRYTETVSALRAHLAGVSVRRADADTQTVICWSCSAAPSAWCAPGVEGSICDPCFEAALDLLREIDAKRAEAADPLPF